MASQKVFSVSGPPASTSTSHFNPCKFEKHCPVHRNWAKVAARAASDLIRLVAVHIFWSDGFFGLESVGVAGTSGATRYTTIQLHCLLDSWSFIKLAETQLQRSRCDNVELKSMPKTTAIEGMTAIGWLPIPSKTKTKIREFIR